MLINKKHIFLFLISAILICSLSCVSADEAIANDTIEDSGISNELEVSVDGELFAQSGDDYVLSKSGDDELGGGIVYFDASAARDGDGSYSSPYKYLTDKRLDPGVTAYFTSGVYEVDEPLNFYSGSGAQVNIIGDGMRNTIIKSLNYDDFVIGNTSTCYVCNLTFEGSHIVSYGNLRAENVIFRNSVNPESNNVTSDYSDYPYSSEYGGAIFSGRFSSPSNNILSLTNCYFENNRAISGGAIEAHRSKVYITNCIFDNSSAPRLGGVIHCSDSLLIVSNSGFENSYASHGGSIYANDAQVQITDSEFYNSQSYGFGGAIACNNTTLIVGSSNFTYSFSSDSGGAVYLHSSQSLIENSLFYISGAFYGGAICSLKSFLNVSGSDFRNNYAAYGGDGYVSYGQVNFEWSNFYNSKAYSQGNSIYGLLTEYLSLINNNFVNSTSSPVVIQYSDGRLVQSGNTADGTSLVIEVHNNNIINLYGSGVASTVAYVPESQTFIPDRYDSRDYGYVTPVKNQKTGGNCWSFAGIAALEACLKKATGITFDFSEENAKNLMTAYSIFGVNSETNEEGGTTEMMVSYLASWLGPISDDKDIYDEYSQLASFYSPLFHIQNVYWLPNRASTSENDVFKKAIMDYGAVVVAVETEESSHAICLVGWDNSYRGYDFQNNTCSIGAWIFKNSWGPDWNDEGFGYLSYNTAFLSEYENSSGHSYTFIFNDTNVYGRVYQYDYAGMTTGYFFNEDDKVLYYKNIFTAVENETLSAVSTYFKSPVDFVVSVYKGDELQSNQSGHSEMGYYTIILDSPVQLNKHDEFTVQFRISNSSGVAVPGCGRSDVAWETFKEGVSFMSTNGHYWSDVYQLGVACIKAFTTPISLSKLNISVDEFATASVGEEVSINVNFNDAVAGSDGSLVTILINDKPYYALVENGHSCLKVAFDREGTYSISAFYKNNKYESNVVNFNVYVNDDLTIRASDVVMYYGGSQQYTVLVTQNGVPVSAIVKISANGKIHTVYTNDKGQASIDLDLPVGTHQITSTVGNLSVSSNVLVKSTVYSTGNSGVYLNSKVNGTFLDSNGELLKNTQVVFNIGNQNFTAITDVYGYAFADVNLDAGKYDVTLINTISGEQKQSRLEISKADSTIVFASSQNGDVLKMTAEVSSAATGYVIFSIDSKNYQVNLKNGIASLELKDLEAKAYDVTVTYSGDGNFNTKTAYESVMVKDVVILLDANDVTQYYGELKTFDVFLTQNGQPLADVYITITIGNETVHAKTNSSGKAHVLISKDVGVYDVVSKYGDCSISNKIIVESTIEASNLVCEYSNASVGATFMDYHGNIAKGIKVKFIIGSQEFEATTDSNGYASVDVGLNQGIYDVTVINTVSYEEKQIRLTVTKANPAISLSCAQIGNVLKLTAALPSAATGKVTFNIDLKDYDVNVTDGVAALQITDLAAKTYTVTATYGGDGNFNGNTAKDSVTIRNDIDLNASDVIQYYGESKKFEVSVTQNGVALANVDVAITIGTKTQSAKTDSNGKAYVLIDNEVGVYDVLAQFGDASISNKVTVKSTITAVDSTGEYLKSSVGATFIDSTGNLLKSKNVKFIIGSKEFTATTDTNGYATAAIGLAPGIYNVTVYNTQSGERKQVRLSIAKATSTTVLSISQNDDEVILTATLTPAAATGKVTFSVAGNTYNANLKNGKASVTIKDLAVGSYKATASYEGDDNFLSSKSSSISFSVVEPREILHANDTTMICGSDDEFVITITDAYGNALRNREINISFDGINSNRTIHVYRHYVAVTGAAGMVTFNSTELYPGTYNVTIISKNCDEIEVKLIIKDPPLVVTAKSSSIYYGADEGFALTLKDANGKPVANTWFIMEYADSGKVFDRLCTDANGRATISSTALGPGTYDFNVVCNGFDDAPIMLTVKSTVAVSDASGTYLNSKVAATFSNTNGNALASRQVTFIVDGRTYTATTNSNGVATANVNVSPGTYTVTALNPASGEEKQFKLAVSKATSATSLSASQKDGVVSLTATVDPGTATGKVTFSVAGKAYTASLNSGKATASISDLGSGSYQATASYEGDGNYLSSKSSSVSFTVDKISSAITADDVTKKQGGPEKLTLTLKDANGNAIADVNVNVALNGATKTLKTDGNGRASMDIDLDVGNYSAAITFDGTGKYSGASKTVTVTVEKKVLTLTANSLSTTYGNVKYIVVNLKDSYETPIADARIDFDLDGSRYAYYGNTYTDENGQAKISSSGVIPDTYTVTISAKDCKDIKTKMTVSKATPKITAAKKTFKVKTKTKKYTITLKNNLGKVMKNTKVKLTVKGKTYTAKTNSKGKATFKITKLNKKGKFTAVVKYAGNSYYKAVSKKVTITVKK